MSHNACSLSPYTLSLTLCSAITLPYSPPLSLSSLPHPLRSVIVAGTLVLSSNPHRIRRHWLQVCCSPLISFLILGNISLCFMWDFDYFVETYLKVVNLLIKMRILLSFICCNDDDLKYFLLYGYVCVIFSLMSLNVLVILLELGFWWGLLANRLVVLWWYLWVCVKCVLFDFD